MNQALYAHMNNKRKMKKKKQKKPKTQFLSMESHKDIIHEDYKYKCQICTW
jgi:hypothetical protein